MMWLMLRKKKMKKKKEIGEFNWEVVIDEATVEGESGSDDRFYDARVDVEEPMTKLKLLRKWLLEIRFDEGDEARESTPRVVHPVIFKSCDEQVT
ncbi:hypothetical protein Dimus_036036, partial [Dionaea muscipula]